MDSAVREISSVLSAPAAVAPKVKPPNARAAPAITCRRVGVMTNAVQFFSALILFGFIIALPDFCCPTSRHYSTRSKYVQDHVLLEGAVTFQT
jgi:hypothetical protein